MTVPAAIPPHRAAWLRRALPLAALALVAAAWLSTLQTALGAAYPPSIDPEQVAGALMDDSGEFVVAWNTWGTAHPPGYPLLNLLGNVLGRLIQLGGVSPVTSASLISFLFAVVALALVGLTVLPADPSGAGAAAAALLPAFGVMTWVFASAAEVYALALALGFACLVLALRAGEQPTQGAALALGLAFGLAMFHHRTLLILVPALIWAAWPARSLGWRPWLAAGLLAAATALIYAYLPLAALADSPWIYGRSPDTWQGFLDAVLAREYRAQIAPPLTVREVAALLVGRADYVAREMTAPAALIGAAGLLVALIEPATRRRAIALALVVAGYVFAPVGQHLLLGTHLPVLAACFALAGGLGLGVAAVARRQPVAAYAALTLTAVLAGRIYLLHRPEVTVYTGDRWGQDIIDAVEALDEDSPLVVETWGPRYSALAYGKWVSGELAGIRLVDARADFAGLPPLETLPETIYTTQDFLYIEPPPAWEAELGYPVRLESAGYGIVALRPALPAAESGGEPTSDPAVVIHSASAWMEGDVVRVTVVWRAVARPLVNYRVFTHVSEGAEIGGPDDILAQADREHPVYGFYPTSRWAAGETVRDDFRIALPVECLVRGCRPATVAVGLYTVEPDGRFVNHIREVLPVERSE